MKKKYYFTLLIACLFLLSMVTTSVLNTEELLFTSLSDQMSRSQVEKMLDFNQTWQWVGYVLLPLFLFIKISLISGVLWTGTFFFERKVTYKHLFTMVTQAEFVFVVVGIIKLLWFVFQDQYTLEDIQSFYPLSALNIVGYEGLQPWFVYPFQTLNLFELAYWMVLAWLIGKELKETTDKGLKIVASSYGPALLIWVVAVMFFTLNVS